MHNPLISVIIPVYNTEDYLKRCVQSIISQTYQNLEIILINDGSTDSSLQICNSFALNDNRTIVIDKINKGVSSARNEGLNLANGDFISFIDSDDWLEKNTYEYLVQLLNEFNVNCVFFEYFIDYENHKKIHKTKSSNYGLINTNRAIEFTISPVNRFACSKLFSKKIINEIRFEPSIYVGEDTLFSCTVLNNAKSVYFTSKPLYHYFQSSISATRNNIFNEKRLSIQAAYEKLIDFCKKEHPNLVIVAVKAYIIHTMNLIIDLYFFNNNNSELIKKLRKDITKNILPVLLSLRIKITSKLKILVFFIYPKLIYHIRKIKQII